MSIADGDPADDGDVWFRVLTDEKYIKKGKINPHAFKGKSIVTPSPEKGRPWDHELSGNLRSLARDVIAEAKRYCVEMTERTGQTKVFSGVMFCGVPEARQTFENAIHTSIHYTPLPSNNSHADLVFRGSANAAEEAFDNLRLWLCNLVIGLHPAQMSLLPRSLTCSSAYSVI